MLKDPDNKDDQHIEASLIEAVDIEISRLEKSLHETE